MSNPDDLLSVNQIHELLERRVTIQTISRWCRNGELRATRVGLMWIVKRSDLDEFLEQRKGEGGRKKAEALAA